MVATPFFTGWLGVGASLSQLVLLEPSDAAYARRPLLYGPLSGHDAEDVSSGSIGPATAMWSIAFAGLFDAAQGGNLLACTPMSRPLTVAAGATLTQSQVFGFRLSIANPGGSFDNVACLAGAPLGQTRDGRVVTACSNLVISNGVLRALASQQTGFAALPVAAPPTGSGQLWNNGGVICVA